MTKMDLVGEDRGCTNTRRCEAFQGMRGKRVYIDVLHVQQ
jgi:hypothetical protein